MKTVLISGCSYSKNIEGDKCRMVFENYFQDKVDVKNISESGSSPAKSINRCYEWTAIHGFPDLVIMPISHLNRYELPIAKEDQLYDTPSLSWNQGKILDRQMYEDKINPLLSFASLQNYLETQNRIDTVNMSYVSTIVRDLVGFATWLKMKECRHMIFNMSNDFKYMQGKSTDKGLEKLHWLKTTRNVYKFFEFSGNEWLWNQLNDIEKQKLEDYEIGLYNPGAVHHTYESYAKLMQYLIKEILETNLDK